MVDEDKEKTDSNAFIMKLLYPEAASIFTSNLKPLEEAKDNSYIVLDTNILLAPYIIGKEDPGKEDLLAACERTYQALVNQKRLIIPGHVAREFAKNRIEKLAELYQQLSRKRNKPEQIQKGKYPLLNAFDEYQKVEKLEKEINEKIQEYHKAISSVLTQIQKWQLNDPVRSLYSNLFTDDIVFDPDFNEDEIRQDLTYRKLHHIPPGYKDGRKEENSVGDLLIWHTILEIGKTKQKNVIFVSGDEKADWFRQSENIALYVRHELIDEFRRISGGKSFYIIKFSRFLELYGASKEVVQEIKQEESLLTEDNIQKKLEDPLEYASSILKQFIKLWDKLIKTKYKYLPIVQEEIQIESLTISDDLRLVSPSLAIPFTIRTALNQIRQNLILLSQIGNDKSQLDQDYKILDDKDASDEFNKIGNKIYIQCTNLLSRINKAND